MRKTAIIVTLILTSACVLPAQVIVDWTADSGESLRAASDWKNIGSVLISNTGDTGGSVYGGFVTADDTVPINNDFNPWRFASDTFTDSVPAYELGRFDSDDQDFLAYWIVGGLSSNAADNTFSATIAKYDDGTGDQLLWMVKGSGDTYYVSSLIQENLPKASEVASTTATYTSSLDGLTWYANTISNSDQNLDPLSGIVTSFGDVLNDATAVGLYLNDTVREGITFHSFEVTVVPEPSAMALVALGVGVVMLRRRRK